MSEKVYLFLVCTSMPTKIVGNAACSYIFILKVFNAAFPTIFVSGFPYHPKTNEHNIQMFFLCPNLFFPHHKMFSKQ